MGRKEWRRGEEVACLRGEINGGIHPIIPVGTWRARGKLKDTAALGDVEHQWCKAVKCFAKLGKKPKRVLVGEIALIRDRVKDQRVMENSIDNALQHMQHPVQKQEFRLMSDRGRHGGPRIGR